MKLVIKEYLTSLREREELDSILPDLLSQMGLNVFSKPSRGTRQDGVDVAAAGKLENGVESVYLFSIKAGNLTRAAWNGSNDQSLRPSIDQIIDSYINNKLPAEHKDKQIVICICLGGDIHETVRSDVKGYIDNIINKNPNIKFEEWNGDKLAKLILSNFLREELLPIQAQSQLRKSLAMLDEPEVSYQYFKDLIINLAKKNVNNEKSKLTILRQMNICLWIQFSWANEAGNIESSYLCSELVLLHAWDIIKIYWDKDSKIESEMQRTFLSILNLYFKISLQYASKILPHVEKLHALSIGVNSFSAIDVNLKLFDILSRLAIVGIWSHFNALSLKNNDDDKKYYQSTVFMLDSAIKNLISNNPILLLPYKDNQAIEITITILFLALNSKNEDSIKSWINEMFSRAAFAYDYHHIYPSIVNSYNDLLVHPKKDELYRKEKTSGSILYPLIALWSCILKDTNLYNQLKEFKKSRLHHCNFQLWYPDEISEEHFYKNDAFHGATLSNISLDLSPEEFVKKAFNECEKLPYFNSLSAVKRGLWPIILVACRHYRLPLPLDLIRVATLDLDFAELSLA